jgi:hypothetical protein
MSEYFSGPKTSWCILQDYIIAYIGNLRNATRLLVNLQFCLFLSRSVAHFLIYRPNFWFKPDVNCYISHKLMDLHVPSHLVRAFRPLENHDHACGAEICCLWTVSRSMSIQAHVYILSIHADVRFVMCGLVRRVVWGMRCRRNHAAVLCFMRAAGRGSRASLTHVYADVQVVDLGDMLWMSTTFHFHIREYAMYCVYRIQSKNFPKKCYSSYHIESLYACIEH